MCGDVVTDTGCVAEGVVHLFLKKMSSVFITSNLGNKRVYRLWPDALVVLFGLLKLNLKRQQRLWPYNVC